jgi:SecA DEAD-like domain
MAARTDGELTAFSGHLRRRHVDGESLDSLLVEAFALVKEATVRKLGKAHYNVQARLQAGPQLRTAARVYVTRLQHAMRAAGSAWPATCQGKTLLWHSLCAWQVAARAEQEALHASAAQRISQNSSIGDSLAFSQLVCSSSAAWCCMRARWRRWLQARARA